MYPNVRKLRHKYPQIFQQSTKKSQILRLRAIWRTSITGSCRVPVAGIIMIVFANFSYLVQTHNCQHYYPKASDVSLCFMCMYLYTYICTYVCMHYMRTFPCSNI